MHAMTVSPPTSVPQSAVKHVQIQLTGTQGPTAGLIQIVLYIQGPARTSLWLDLPVKVGSRKKCGFRSATSGMYQSHALHITATHAQREKYLLAPCANTQANEVFNIGAIGQIDAQ